jgi:hypothetical protein
MRGDESAIKRQELFWADALERAKSEDPEQLQFAINRLSEIAQNDRVRALTIELKEKLKVQKELKKAQVAMDVNDVAQVKRSLKSLKDLEKTVDFQNTKALDKIREKIEKLEKAQARQDAQDKQRAKKDQEVLSRPMGAKEPLGEISQDRLTSSQKRAMDAALGEEVVDLDRRLLTPRERARAAAVQESRDKAQGLLGPLQRNLCEDGRSIGREHDGPRR